MGLDMQPSDGCAGSCRLVLIVSIIGYAAPGPNMAVTFGRNDGLRWYRDGVQKNAWLGGEAENN